MNLEIMKAMKPILSVALALLSCQLLSAQPRRSVHPRGEIPAVYADYLRPDTVSVDEMVESYKAVKAGTQPKPRLSDYDQSLHRGTVFPTSILAGESLFSGRPLVAEWATLNIHDTIFVCLTDLYRRGTDVRDTAAWAEADRALGVSVDKVGLSQRRVVPARWLSGTFVRVSDAMPYFGFVVGHGRHVQAVKDGRLVDPVVTDRINSYYWSCAFSHQMHFDGDWAMELPLSMTLLSHDASQACTVDTTLRGKPRVYDLLLTIDAEGRLDFVLLHTETYIPRTEENTVDPAADRRYLDELRRFLHGLPPYALEPLYTADGRVFPGRYMQVRRLSNGWRFRDYIADGYAQLLAARKLAKN